ncbi:MAG: hypothetical protein IKU61_02485 [Clostridia bacterium]|nr:hypothetical protein [Clostridia bacterium]
MAIFTNQATLSYNGTTVNSNIVTGNIVEVLAASKTAVGGTFSVGDDITYIISITNSGAIPFTNVTVTDNLGEYDFGTGTLTPLDYVEGSAVYYQNGVLQAAPTVASAAPLTFTGITVPAGGNAMIIYEAVANGFAPPVAGGTITNTVTINGGGITAPVTAEETVTATEGPRLSITKGLSPVIVTDNSPLTYTFTIQNTGNAEAIATDNVVITDTFNPVLSNISVTLDGVILPPTAYTYNEVTGEFATVPGAITVPAATFEQDAVTGNYTVTPGVTVVTVTGTV